MTNPTFYKWLQNISVSTLDVSGLKDKVYSTCSLLRHKKVKQKNISMSSFHSVSFITLIYKAIG